MSLLTAAEHSIRDCIVRCGVLYAPSTEGIRRWDCDALIPYVKRVDDGGVHGDLFGGLLFEADLADHRQMISGRSVGLGDPPTAAAWLQVAEELFQPGFNVSAALAASRQADDAVDLWIALPYPFQNQSNFGDVNGRALDFQGSAEHRMMALDWWIGVVLNKWQQVCSEVPGHRLVLRGFAWTRSMLWLDDEPVIRAVAATVHRNRLKLMWCCNYGTERIVAARDLGFDLVLIRPLYRGIEPRGRRWVEAAVACADEHHCGLIFAGDMRRCAELFAICENTCASALRLFELSDGGIWRTQPDDPGYSALVDYISGDRRAQQEVSLDEGSALSD